MRNLFLLVAGCLMFVQAQSKELTANFMSSAFSTPDNKTYIETYLSILGNSVHYTKNSNGKFQATVDVFITILANDSIRDARRYLLNSPETDDTTKAANFLDLQRFTLPVGIYTVKVALTDVNRQPQRVVANQKNLMLDIDPDSIGLSHVEMLETYRKSESATVISKSGFDLIPYVSSFYPENMTNLSFYAEIYNTKKVLKPEDKFLVLYYIENADTKSKLNDFNAFQKMSPQPVNSLLYTFDISKLPTGSYNLVVEVRSSTNRMISFRKNYFERFNPGVQVSLEDVATLDVSKTFAGKITNPDTLKDYIRSLRPISTESEKEFAESRIKAGDIQLMQQYLYNFWLSRNEINPEGAFIAYNVEVQKVNKEFGTQILKGYETDRGRVYLQYGPPDQRVPMYNEPSSYPYEIWQYYTIRGKATDQNLNQPGNTTQTNRRFVFANFDLVTNNFMLIHSDARGEVRDDRWQIRLTKRDNPNNDLDSNQGPSRYGSQSDDFFNNPR